MASTEEPEPPSVGMTVRKVDLDFSAAAVHWNPRQPEYSQLLNAISTAIPLLEPFLIRTVRAAKARLPAEGAEELRADVDTFVGQEGRHHRLHSRFNRRLREEGYEVVRRYEERLAADYQRFEQRDLRFRLAYSEGFETFGPLVSSFFFERGRHLMGDDVDEPTVYLWMWHFAEEYEHRTVCNHLYRDLYDVHWYRLYGLGYATVHLFGYSVRLCAGLLRNDHRERRVRGRFRSWVRFGAVVGRLFADILPKMARTCVRRGYDPQDIPPPRGVMAFLDEASERYEVAG